MLGKLRARVRDHRQRRVRARALKDLEASPDGAHRAFAEAYRVTGAGRLAADESRLIETIEGLRDALADSERTISYRDFGAGNPGDDLTAEQMARGRDRVISVRDVIRHGNLGRRYRLLLFHLIRRLKPRLCVELGTSLGMSCAYQAAALRLNGGGHLVTLEGCENTAAMARENLTRLGLDEAVTIVVGRFQDTLDGVLTEHAPVDFAFVDGHHDGDATVGYYEKLAANASGDAVLVFDDIQWYESMKLAWQRIATDPGASVAIHCGVVGAILLGGPALERSPFHLGC